MKHLRIYLDNCCYNRPFDDLNVKVIRNEAYAKMYIQSQVKFGGLELVYSFMSLLEIEDSPFLENKRQIMSYIENHASYFVGEDRKSDIEKTVNSIMQTGIKHKDAVHIACALYANCDFFITTDKRLLKYQEKEMKIVNPLDFITLQMELL